MYSVLLAGGPSALAVPGCKIDIKPEAADLDGYDLAIDLVSGKIIFPITGEYFELPQDADLEELISEKIRLLSAQEIDKEFALDMLAGSEMIYRNSLRLYHSEYNNLAPRLEEHFSRKEFSEMRDLVHRLKGFVLYTGGKLLHQVAGILENELINGRHDHYRHFLRLHERLLAYCQVENV